MTREFNLMIVAGEPSGDAHAASLVQALRMSDPLARFTFFGSTGQKMRGAGVESIVFADDLAIMGILEVGKVLPRFWKAFRALKDAATLRRPDAVILVDWPEFNLRLARSLHRTGIRVIYYISPQVWAWRSKRIRSIQRDVDLLLCILPFEPAWYNERGLTNAEFVGHPLTGELHPRWTREEFCERHDLDSSHSIAALLPGSRPKEIERILPTLLETAVRMNRKDSEVQFVLALAPAAAIAAAEILDARRNELPDDFRIVTNETIEALAAANVAAIASGTATLEAAILGTPFVMVYKESAVNWHTLGRLITAEYFGLVNLIAGERVVAELMQGGLTADNVSSELFALLDTKENEAMRTRLHDVAAKLGSGDASERAADAIIKKLVEWEPV